MTYFQMWNYSLMIHPIFHKIISTNELKTDLENISNWSYHWKMCFDEDPSKQAKKLFSSMRYLLNLYILHW